METNKLDDVSAILRTIQSAEKSLDAYTKIGPVLNPKEISQLDRVLVPSDDNTLTEVTESDKIFEQLLLR